MSWWQFWSDFPSADQILGAVKLGFALALFWIFKLVWPDLRQLMRDIKSSRERGNPNVIQTTGKGAFVVGPSKVVAPDILKVKVRNHWREDGAISRFRLIDDDDYEFWGDDATNVIECEAVSRFRRRPLGDVLVPRNASRWLHLRVANPPELAEDWPYWMISVEGNRKKGAWGIARIGQTGTPWENEWFPDDMDDPVGFKNWLKEIGASKHSPSQSAEEEQ